MKLALTLAALLLPAQAFAYGINPFEPEPGEVRPTPTPTPTPTPEPTTAGKLPVVDGGVDVPSNLIKIGLPKSAAPDVVGAFRFICGAGQIAYDDPIVYPGQKGKAHLHQFFGNLGADGNSTYASLRSSGESTCTNELNRSAYWVPALLDGKGNVIRPNYISLYYKRRPASDPKCLTEGAACVDLPRGIRFIFGWDQNKANEPQPGNSKAFQFRCVKKDGSARAGRTFEIPASVCEPGDKFYIAINSPDCWDGVRLDSPDHRSHLAGKEFGQHTDWKPKCPATHPYIIPSVTQTLQYSVVEGDDMTLWHLASDHMLPPELYAPGASMHADYWEAWKDAIRDRWHAGCFNMFLNCSDGDLGDGWMMKRNKHFPKGQVTPRLVAIPEKHLH